MTSREESTTQGKRIHFLDNLRTIIIFLVVLYHVGGVYEGAGMWAEFWIVDDPTTNDLCGVLNLIVDVFAMPTLFLISGYLTPASLNGKGGGEFLKSRFRRLIIPWTIAVLTLVPLYKVLFLASRGLPQESWTTYFHLSNGSVTGQGHLWFLPMLFLFNTLYVLFSRAGIRVPNISPKTALVGTFLIGWAYSASMDLFGLRGWTLSPLLDFQRERVLIYFVYFLLGALCFRLKVFDAKPESKVLSNIVSWTCWIPITVYIVFLILPVLGPGTFILSRIIDRVIVWFCFHLSLLCLVYLMIVTFWWYFDKPGRIWDELNRNSYGVYIIHVIVLGGIAWLLLNSALPSLLKYLILTLSTVIASNLIVSLYRRAVTSAKAMRQRKTQLVPG
jgi:peptidoglycan/LPS O-acetylase OafA/YrhL